MPPVSFKPRLCFRRIHFLAPPYGQLILSHGYRKKYLGFPRIRNISISQVLSDQKRTSPALKGRENIYTLPNALTFSRILACPFLGWFIVSDNFTVATGILIYAGVSDWLDGFLARRYSLQSVLGTILDPAADKALMTTLTVTLTIKGLLPLPLACIILGRDIMLSLAAFVVRYRTLPPPKTMSRYWNFAIPSAEVHPSKISKLNTVLQLLLMGVTTIHPLLSIKTGLPLEILQWSVGCTTIWSGVSYAFSTTSVRRIH